MTVVTRTVNGLGTLIQYVGVLCMLMVAYKWLGALLWAGDTRTAAMAMAYTVLALAAFGIGIGLKRLADRED
jgi:hypothetical protein